MNFACLRDSYLRELATKVVSCTKVEKDGKEFYDVVLKDTVMFPGGCGQPFDLGTVNDIPVLSIRKENGQAVHVLQSPVKAEDNAVVVVHWSTRFDHMQQHTGQHLITALAENMFHRRTTSWNLGAEESYIEMDSSLDNFQIEQIEQNANEIIRNCSPVTVHYYEQGDEELSTVRTRHELPEDHSNLIRVVTINGVDRTICWGTHVKFTSELQAIKLLYVGRAKTRGRSNLYFIVGDRLLKYARTSVSREKALTPLLGCGPREIISHVQHLQNSVKMANKNAEAALRDVAVLEAKIFNVKLEKPAVFTLHRKNAGLDFISVFLNEAKSDETLFFLTTEHPKSGCRMVLSGPLELVKKYGPQVCRILDGEGSLKDGKYQGKVKKLSNIPQAELLMKNDLCIDHIFQL